MHAYGSPQSPQGYPPQTGQPGQPMPPANGQPPANGPALTMNGYTPDEPEKPLSEMEKAMKRLVNVERIDEPAEQEYKLTMMKKEEDDKKKKKGKSHGLPPAATGVVGSNATLNDITKVKPVSINGRKSVHVFSFLRPILKLAYFKCSSRTGDTQDRRRYHEGSSSAFPSRCSECRCFGRPWARSTTYSKRVRRRLRCTATSLQPATMVISRGW